MNKQTKLKKEIVIWAMAIIFVFFVAFFLKVLWVVAKFGWNLI